MDLILAYYDYLGVPRTYGNGSDYAWNKLPDGWTRIQGGVPQKGDILVYVGGYNNYGHVAIFESTNSSYHQNFNSHKYVERVTYAYNSLNPPYWGLIRPDFADGSQKDNSQKDNSQKDDSQKDDGQKDDSQKDDGPKDDSQKDDSGSKQPGWQLPDIFQNSGKNEGTPQKPSVGKKVAVGKACVKALKNKKGKRLQLSLGCKSGKAASYEVCYATNKKFKNAVTKTCNNSGQCTLKNLKKNQTYYVKVRACATCDGQKKCGAWSGIQKIKVTK